MLNFKAIWSQPVSLIDGSPKKLTYMVKDIASIPEDPGAYVFVRIRAGKVYPLYIGESGNLRKRVNQHFKNNVVLMNNIKGCAKDKKRAFIYCTIKTGSSEKKKAMLALLQKALIEHALAEGHELFNIQGAKPPVHTISFTGNASSQQIAPRTMYVK